MSYKKEIDRLREHKKIIEFNLKQISYDISTLPPDLNELFSEHHQETKRLRSIEDRIYKLQPAWRRWLGVLY